MGFLDYYTMLGASPSANEDDLRVAYRLAARRFHPDVNKSPGASLVFKNINAAYEVLSDPVQRASYDRVWEDRASATTGLLLETFYSRHNLRPIDEPQLLYVLLKVHPLLEMSLSTDAPLNLALVVDRSTSMKGERLHHVKSAAQRIIDECRPQDVVSLITFSDNAEVIIPAQHPTDPRNLKSLISTVRADGATAILAGLRAGLAQVERNRSGHYVNHVVLITDGRTYGDEEDCLVLAGQARENGVGISGMGIGEDWNDSFLDKLASVTGGSSAYVNTPSAVTRFLHDRIRSLATAYAERSALIAAPATDVELESITRVSPDPMTLDVNEQPIPLGTLDGLAGMSIMLQFHLNTSRANLGEFFVGRVEVGGEVLGSGQRSERVVQDLTISIVSESPEESPPPELLDALSRLSLYRLQERAREALEEGDVAEATRKLEALATRLFESGNEDLGQVALQEARRVAHTHQLSDEGSKQIKYGTRALLPFTEDDR